MSDAVPNFKVVTDATNDAMTGSGSKLFAMGQEMSNVERFDYKTSFGADEVVRTTITITYFGAIEVQPPPTGAD